MAIFQILSVHKFTAVSAIQLETDWLDIRSLRWLEMLRYKNRLAKMDESRLPVRVYKWMKSLKVDGWVKNVNFILEHANMSECTVLKNTCDLEVLEARLKVINHDRLWLEANTRSKLRTFV